MREKGIAAFRAVCDPDLRGENLEEFFQNDALVITIPFRRGLSDPRFYFQQIQSIIRPARQSGRTPFVILTGSTSVYPFDAGPVDEKTDFIPDGQRAETLLNVEALLLQDSSLPATVLRLAGLYGPGRPIGKFLAEKKDIPGGNEPVNLVHQEDAVRAVYEVLVRDVRGEIFNVVSDGHPTRRELYVQAAQNLELQLPQFSTTPGGRGKTVLNQKIKRRLGFDFRHPDPLHDAR